MTTPKDSKKPFLLKLPNKSNKTPLPPYESPWDGSSKEELREMVRNLGAVLRGDQSHLNKPIDSLAKKKD